MKLNDETLRSFRVVLPGIAIASAVLLLEVLPGGRALQHAADSLCAGVAYHVLGKFGVPIFLYGIELIGPHVHYEVHSSIFPVIVAGIVAAFWPLSPRKRVLWLPGALLAAAAAQLFRVMTSFLITIQVPRFAGLINTILWPAIFAGIILYVAWLLRSKEEAPAGLQAA